MSLSSQPVSLPSSPPPRARATIPLYAALAPVAGGIVLWVVTGSAVSLWLAGLAPLMLAASALDARRTARREGRRAEAERVRVRDRAVEEIARQHEVERARLCARHPDVTGYLAPDGPVWRADAGWDALVLGRGPRPSAVRVSGGDGDAAAARVRESAATLEDAPIVAAAGEGVAVVGPAGIARAVVRALAAQACLALSPGALRVSDEATHEHPWMAGLPHARDRGRRVLAVLDPGRPVPVEADLVIARVEPAAPVPPGCRVVLTLVSPTTAEVTRDGETQRVAIEAVSEAQAHEIAAGLTARQAATDAAGVAPAVVLADLLGDAPPAAPGALPAVVGAAGARPFVLDLVRDGPHAVVVGVTGAGKSELLVSWVLSLCATHAPGDVVFLLADFKGGTAFQPLAALPHVTGVLTDLDGDAAHRAIESLRAELRVREAAIAAAGARDVGDPAVGLPRLVIVVDEFAALSAQHPELLDVFTDVAARGRALGMHLVLGTQRAAGVLREALLSNCPLRVCLRVTDPADSRAVVGVDDAADLPGDLASRGWALVRRAADGRPERVRIARTDTDDLARVVRDTASGPARRPWVPPLPTRLGLGDVPADGAPGAITLGLADEPDRQRHAPVALHRGERGLIVLGTAGAGKTTALALVGAQTRGRVHVVGPDLEQAWDAVDALADRPAGPDDVVLVDDLDGLLARFPAEYAQAFGERLELVVRAAGGGGCRLVVSAQRLGGPVGRVLELVPRRALLALPSRADYLAAGGDPVLRPATTPGRAVLDGRAVQFALPDVRDGLPSVGQLSAATDAWDAQSGVVGMVLRPGAAAHARVDALTRQGVRVVTVDQARELRGQAPAGGLAIVGGPDAWQQEWRVLGTVRERHDLVIDAGCAGEYRLMSGDRGLPPYCAPGASRGWLLRRGAAPVRTTLPAIA